MLVNRLDRDGVPVGIACEVPAQPISAGRMVGSYELCEIADRHVVRGSEFDCSDDLEDWRPDAVIINASPQSYRRPAGIAAVLLGFLAL
jgi:hypothetical protein